MLTPQEATELFGIVRALREQGKSIIFISHKLDEVLEIADRVTVLGAGRSRDGADAQARRRRGSRG